MLFRCSALVLLSFGASFLNAGFTNCHIVSCQRSPFDMKMAERLFNLKERASIVKFYYETKNAAEVVRRFKREYPDSEAPDRVTVSRTVKRFEESCSVNYPIEMKEAIWSAFEYFDCDLCAKICRPVVARCEKCIVANVGHFENL